MEPIDIKPSKDFTLSTPSKRKGYSLIILTQNHISLDHQGFTRQHRRYCLKTIKNEKVEKFLSRPIEGHLVMKEYTLDTLPAKYKKLSVAKLEKHTLQTHKGEYVKHNGNVVFRFTLHDKKFKMVDTILKKHV
jgi:hypothetical protein